MWSTNPMAAPRSPCDLLKGQCSWPLAASSPASCTLQQAARGAARQGPVVTQRQLAPLAAQALPCAMVCSCTQNTSSSSTMLAHSGHTKGVRTFLQVDLHISTFQTIKITGEADCQASLLACEQFCEQHRAEYKAGLARASAAEPHSEWLQIARYKRWAGVQSTCCASSGVQCHHPQTTQLCQFGSPLLHQPLRLAQRRCNVTRAPVVVAFLFKLAPHRSRTPLGLIPVGSLRPADSHVAAGHCKSALAAAGQE